MDPPDMISVENSPFVPGVTCAIEIKFPLGEVTVNVTSVVELVVLPITIILLSPNVVSAERVMALGLLSIIPGSGDLAGDFIGDIVEPVTVNCICAVLSVFS